MAFPDSRFFAFRGPFTAERAAEIGSAAIVRGAGGAISTVAEAGKGGEGALIFSEKLKGEIAAAEAIIVPEGRGGEAPEGIAIVLEAKSPKLAFSKIAAALFASRSETAEEGDAPTIARTAKVHETAVIGPGAEIGEGVIIGPNAVIGHGVILGEGTYVAAGASIAHAEIGKNCRILAGAVIGEAGFGYTAGETGPVAVPQLGAVRLADEVDIGAQTTVDRGALGDTVIGAMSKIDNLCQIAHNCRLGRGVLVASQTGISGSCIIGDFVMMGGQVGMADHLNIGDGAVIAAKSGLMKDVEPGGKVGGTPAKPMRQWMKETAALGRLAGGKK
ncbi:UDP-3-O-(3-hydroxymyristoyl)glucosamine N-acyltransferase [Parvularcula sp. ZS-1/3]|uniref:UDP-3-O-(3-hydroxymyristoyl)glucosamine N-acyltransferase n=1 Tax=Parvularcula mediterranea TaxID=2732508 RepID=A0A7Y3RNW6_9PROT|nr:UDP-3-O-(3-hydroxymyristoyl)glucosamine N-acyltransferase [Parvularcula mediterranea]NNU16692.1 UDP-3-O-(3-hydroxymyristoyl)glucosamine N-acyltransferase [Parvularcula mediterranea]